MTSEGIWMDEARSYGAVGARQIRNCKLSGSRLINQGTGMNAAPSPVNHGVKFCFPRSIFRGGSKEKLVSHA